MRSGLMRGSDGMLIIEVYGRGVGVLHFGL